MSAHNHLDERAFWRALFVSVAIGIAAVIALSDAFVPVLIRQTLIEVFS
jgi:anti-sigma-K factor RskA